MIFKEEDKPIIKRLTSNSIHAQQSESNNDLVAEVTFLSLVIHDSVPFAELLWQRGDYEHATEYVQNGIECNIRIMKRFLEMKRNIKTDVLVLNRLDELHKSVKNDKRTNPKP